MNFFNVFKNQTNTYDYLTYKKYLLEMVGV